MHSHSLVCALAVDHEDNGRKQDAWLREWLGASEGDYFESKGAKRKKLTPEERKEKAAKNGRQAQAAARRGEWTRNTTFGGFDPKCVQVSSHCIHAPHPYLPTPLVTSPRPSPRPSSATHPFAPPSLATARLPSAAPGLPEPSPASPQVRLCS